MKQFDHNFWEREKKILRERKKFWQKYSHKFIGIGSSTNEVPSWAQALSSISQHGNSLWVALKAVVKWELAAHHVKHHIWIFVHLFQPSLHKRMTNWRDGKDITAKWKELQTRGMTSNMIMKQTTSSHLILIHLVNKTYILTLDMQVYRSGKTFWPHTRHASVQ